MEDQIQESWSQLRSAVSLSQNVSALSLAAYLVLGGLLALYIRLLYRHCSQTASDTESFTRIFPLLTLVTIGVIAVVKSSMALSLGLVGALSIVRFRAAIKEPEELVYLFLCIGVGLALGASQPLLAIVLVLVATVFVLGMSLTGRGRIRQSLLLTITGDADRNFHDGPEGVVAVLSEIAGPFLLQRLDLESGRGQIRVVLRQTDASQIARLVMSLRSRLPGCEFSWVNLNSIL